MIRETWLLETSCAFKDMSQEQNAVTWTIKPVKPKLNKNGKYRTTSWCQDLYTRHAGSIGCAIWLVFRRSLVRSSIHPHIFHRDLEMNYSLPTANSSRAVVSYCRTYGHFVLPNHWGNLPRNSEARLIDGSLYELWMPGYFKIHIIIIIIIRLIYIFTLTGYFLSLCCVITWMKI